MENVSRSLTAQTFPKEKRCQFESLTTCPLHYQVHICRAGESCILTEDGTCHYTGRNVDGLARTHLPAVDGHSDFSSNALAQTRSECTTNKPGKAADIMDLDTFINNVQHGLLYGEQENDPSSERLSLSRRMKLLLEKIHAIMSYNNSIKKTGNVTSCEVWIVSTVQVLRGLQGKSIIPDMPSKSEVKAIVLQILLSLELQNEPWWARRSCIAKQWRD